VHRNGRAIPEVCGGEGKTGDMILKWRSEGSVRRALPIISVFEKGHESG
jgi:hypothetical protein